MLSRCSSMIGLTTLALLFSSLVFGVSAAADDKTRLGNDTIERTLQLRTHSLFAPYIDQDLQNRWWDFGADSYVNTNKHIRLTRNVPSQMGWLWSRLAITVTNFVIEVEFKISGDSTHLFGDGLAIWLTSERAEPGPVFGSKDEFTGLGIFLDTYPNSHHQYTFPRIVGVLGDGKTKYNYGNDGDDQAVGACSANFRRTNVVTKLKITYVRNGFLDVKVQHKAWDQWEDCFYVEKIALPANPFLGFSAMTGDVSDAHDIVSVTSWSAILSQPGSHPNAHNKAGYIDSKASSGSWLGFFFKLFLFATAMLIHTLFLLCLSYAALVLAQKGPTLTPPTVLPSDSPTPSPAPPASLPLTNSTTPSATSTAFPGLSTYSPCVSNCLQVGVARVNCPTITEVNCFCNNTQFPLELMGCIQSDCPTELATAENLAQRFCGLASGSLTLSFPSVTPAPSVTTPSTSTPATTSTSPPSSTTNAALSHRAPSQNILLVVVVTLAVCGGAAFVWS